MYVAEKCRNPKRVMNYGKGRLRHGHRVLNVCLFMFINHVMVFLIFSFRLIITAFSLLLSFLRLSFRGYFQFKSNFISNLKKKILKLTTHCFCCNSYI